MQIYFYDGWKFNESPIDFTGDSFGAGVVSMRTYDNIINGTTTIGENLEPKELHDLDLFLLLVIANRDSFDPTWNVYTPIYAMKNDSSRLKSSISKWCNDAFNRLENFNVDEADEVLKSALELTDPSSERANFMGKVFISNSSIGTITAKQLKGTRVAFNNETAQRVNSLADRIAKLTAAVQHVNNKIKFTKATQRTRRQTPMLIKTLIVNGPIRVETLNGRPVADLVYKANRRNQRMTNVVAKEVLIMKELFVNQKIDGIELAEDNVIMNRDQVLRPMTVESINVKSIADIATVNSVPIAEFFTLLRRKVDRKIPNMIQELNVDSLSIGRFLNDRNFTGIAINSLKTSGDQIFTAPINIGQLKANNIMFQKVLRDQRISNISLTTFIDINDTRQNIEINQDIRFGDVFINRLFVKERINNVNISRGQLQVMRTRGPERQIVTGEKFFDQVNLLSPIVLQGKIESKTLQKMNPIITIDEELTLQGDYKITGPVSIRRSMRATDDITTSNQKLSLKNLVENGLNLFTTNASNNKFVFQNVLQVKRNLEVFSVNQKLVKNFLKVDFPELQTVAGLTTFKKGLLVHGGTVQADFINGIDINELNKTVLKRFSPVTQFIDGNVEIANLQTPQLLSASATINGKNIRKVLNGADEEQIVDKITLSHSKVKSLNIENMHQQPGGKIFGTNVDLLIDDTVLIDSSIDSSAVSSKSFTDLTVEHLTFSQENEWKSIIRNYENSIVQDINVTGSMVFSNEMRVGNLVVTGTINNVKHEDMIGNWLLVEGDQIFSAPQTFASLSIDNNLFVPSETINSVNITKMIDESFWIDEPIYVKNLEIEGEMLVWGKFLTPTVNGMNLEGKLMLNNTNEHQTVKAIVLERDIAVEFINFTHLNGVDCKRLISTLAGDNGTANLQIRGNAQFNYPPDIVYLNNQNLEKLYGSIWIADTDVELTGDDIQFLGGVKSDGIFYADVSSV